MVDCDLACRSRPHWRPPLRGQNDQLNRNQHFQRHENYPQIEPQRGIANVVFVVLIFFLRRQKLAAVDLSPAGNAWADHKPGGRIRRLILRQQRARTDQAMSPTRTFNNCGSSSKRVWRKNCPITDNFLRSGTGRPRQSNGARKVRNLCSMKRWPPWPIRCCQNNTGGPMSKSTSTAQSIRSGRKQNDHR